MSNTAGVAHDTLARPPTACFFRLFRRPGCHSVAAEGGPYGEKNVSQVCLFIRIDISPRAGASTTRRKTCQHCETERESRAIDDGTPPSSGIKVSRERAALQPARCPPEAYSRLAFQLLKKATPITLLFLLSLSFELLSQGLSAPPSAGCIFSNGP